MSRLHRHRHTTRQDARQLDREARYLLMDIAIGAGVWALLLWASVAAHAWVSRGMG